MGFGSATKTHRMRAQSSARLTRSLKKDVASALKSGHCRAAVKLLAVTAYNAGRLRVERRSAGAYGRRTVKGKKTYRAPVTFVRSLAERVARVCAR